MILMSGSFIALSMKRSSICFVFEAIPVMLCTNCVYITKKKIDRNVWEFYWSMNHIHDWAICDVHFKWSHWKWLKVVGMSLDRNGIHIFSGYIRPFEKRSYRKNSIFSTYFVQNFVNGWNFYFSIGSKVENSEKTNKFAGQIQLTRQLIDKFLAESCNRPRIFD